MAVRVRADGRRGEHATLTGPRALFGALALVVIGLGLIVFVSDSLPAVVAGILAITAAAFLAMRR